MGKIITFYSYKGGVGRTMCLANIAVLLARWKYRTLIVDWDLEAPGLEHFYHDFIKIDQAQAQKGVIDLLTENNTDPQAVSWWKKAIVNIPLPDTTTPLHLLTAGNRDENYYTMVRQFDVKNFYNNKNGGEIIEELRTQWKSEYDFILVDSRTGITDIGGICTVQLPEILVMLFTATEQGFNGIRSVAQRALEAKKKLGFNPVNLMILPVPTRIDNTENDLTDFWMDKFDKGLGQIYESWLPRGVNTSHFLFRTKVPYIPFYSFGEGLAVFDKKSTIDTAGIGYACESIAALLATGLNYPGFVVDNRDKLISLADNRFLDDILSKLEPKIKEILNPSLINEMLSLKKDAAPITPVLLDKKSIPDPSNQQLNALMAQKAAEVYSEVSYYDYEYVQVMQERIERTIADVIKQHTTTSQSSAEYVSETIKEVIDHFRHKIATGRDRFSRGKPSVDNNVKQAMSQRGIRRTSVAVVVGVLGALIIVLALFLFRSFHKTDADIIQKDSINNKLQTVLLKDSAKQALDRSDTSAADDYLDRAIQASRQESDTAVTIDLLKQKLRISRDFDSLAKPQESTGALEQLLNTRVYRVDVFYDRYREGSEELADTLVQILSGEKNLVTRKRSLRSELFKTRYRISSNTIVYNMKEQDIVYGILKQLKPKSIYLQTKELRDRENQANYLSIFIKEPERSWPQQQRQIAE